MTLLSYLPCPLQVCYIWNSNMSYGWTEIMRLNWNHYNFQCQPNQYFCLCNIADRRSKLDRNTVYLFLDWLFVRDDGLAIEWYATSPDFRYLSYLLSYSKSKVPIPHFQNFLFQCAYRLWSSSNMHTWSSDTSLTISCPCNSHSHRQSDECRPNYKG